MLCLVGGSRWLSHTLILGGDDVPPAKRQQGWSYSAGKWGVNRVRAFERPDKGKFVEWFEAEPSTGGVRKRRRLALGRITRDEAETKADAIALAFRRGEDPAPKRLSLGKLFDMYEQEVTVSKSETTQAHDRRCLEMLLRAFGATREPGTLSRRDLDRFVADRRAGRIAPAGVATRRKVRDRPIEQDCALLNAVLNWATRAGDGKGGALLDRNPLKGLAIPREASPRRPVCSDAQYQAMLKAAQDVGPWAACFTMVVHEAGHRAASVRQLRWSDVDLTEKRVHWRGEADKIRFDHWTPLTDAAAQALAAEQARAAAIGDAWVFPARRDARQPLSRDGAANLWKRLATKAGLPEGERYGWHSLRRAFATDLKGMPLKDLCHLGGWKNPAVLLTAYQVADEETQRTALKERKPVGVRAVSGAK